MDIMEKMKELICNYVEVSPEDITRDSEFIGDLGFNSYDIMSMLGDAEAEFDIEIDQEKIAGLKTVGEVVDYFGGLIDG